MPSFGSPELVLVSVKYSGTSMGAVITPTLAGKRVRRTRYSPPESRSVIGVAGSVDSQCAVEVRNWLTVAPVGAVAAVAVGVDPTATADGPLRTSAPAALLAARNPGAVARAAPADLAVAAVVSVPPAREA